MQNDTSAMTKHIAIIVLERDGVTRLNALAGNDVKARPYWPANGSVSAGGGQHENYIKTSVSNCNSPDVRLGKAVTDVPHA